MKIKIKNILNKIKLVIVSFFKLIFKGLDYILKYVVGYPYYYINKLIKKSLINFEKFWETKRPFIWGLFVISFIIVNNLIFDNILFDYTIFYPYNWIVKLLSGGDSIYSKIFANFGLMFWDGIKTTINLSLIGTVVGFLIALIFSLVVTIEDDHRDNVIVKTLKIIGKLFVKLYVTIIRSTPMMVQAMIFYYGLKPLIGWSLGTAALFTVSINTAAYLTEVLRGAIVNLDKGQNEAARSLGLSKWQTMKGIIYPQAIKNAMPSIGNEFIINVKDTAVLSVIMVVDIFRVAEIAQGRYGVAFPPFLIAAGMYLILTLSVTLILRKVEEKFSIPKKELPSAN